MKTVVAFVCVAFCTALAMGADVAIQDFEGKVDPPKVWVVNMPEGSSTAEISDKAAAGKGSLMLRYKFTDKGQYLGVPLAVSVSKPIQKLRFQLLGDKSGSGFGVYVIDASGETHKYRDPAIRSIDFEGWKEVTIDLAGGHETWGGDKNGKIDYPISTITFEVGTPGKATDSQLCFDSVVGEPAVAPPSVSVLSPAYCADVKGDTPISIAAAGFRTVTAKSWKPGGQFGTPATVATIDLDEKGAGSFVFPADQYPHGPITVTISGDNGKLKDNCYLQLYNQGGVVWNQGIPKEAPPAAKGLDLLFSDDFDGPLSIGAEKGDRYFDHKPPRGETDFSHTPFVSHSKPNTPFSQVDSYLRIRASDEKKSAGIISSIQSDGSGFKVAAPAYFECRFIGPNAPGSWPAFWLMTDHMSDGMDKNRKQGCDELDIIEAYGGEGPKRPNAFDKFMISPHCWNQGDEGHAIQEKAVKNLKRPTEMKKYGIPSTWYEAFHTYGCLVTKTETVYYVDDIEVGRHPTLPLCQEKPLFFMINLATGGGWPVDLSRYNGTIDMYTDYVRVYGKRDAKD